MDSHDPSQLDPNQSLKRPLEQEQFENAHSPKAVPTEGSAVTKVEKFERNGVNGLDSVTSTPDPAEEPAQKKVKLDVPESATPKMDARDKVKGIALVKPE